MSESTAPPRSPSETAERRPLGDILLSMMRGFRRPVFQMVEVSTLLREARLVSPRQMGLAVVFGGVCGTGVLVVLNAEAKLVEQNSYSLSYALLFILLIVGYRFAQKLTMSTATTAVEEALDRIRQRVAAKVTLLSLRDFEATSREEIYASMARHYETISQSTVQLVAAAQAFVLLTLIIVYMLIVSFSAFVMWATVTLIVVVTYRAKAREQHSAMLASEVSEKALLGNVDDVLQGFRELKLDADKRADLLGDIAGHSQAAARLRVRASLHFIEVLVFSNSIFYLLAGALVFVLPVFSTVSHRNVFEIVTIVTFVLGPLGSVVSSLQVIAKARFALRSLFDFEERLDRIGEAEQPTTMAPTFQRLDMRDLRYVHLETSGATAFAVGPLNLTLSKGEIVFLTGGNGSGKSTALKLLMALYQPSGGSLVLNGHVLAGGEVAGYRSLFTAIFAESHVFRRVRGLSPQRRARLQAILEEFGIAGKVPSDLTESSEAGKLSTGQRKRLALAIAIVEDRPVLVLDEWAADQDPEHRSAFYRSLLPRLKADGRTVLAVTHDDRYFDAADRRYHMEEGHIVEISRS